MQNKVTIAKAITILLQTRDMLPPLKSQILKWGLLAQWLY